MPSESSDGTKRELINKDRTFFCSELVAKACKVLGILEDDGTSSSQFFPKAFSSKGDSQLKLTPNTVLEEEQQIILDNEENILDTYQNPDYWPKLK